MTPQTQLRKSQRVDDSLPLAGYEDLETLEQDLNYLRSVIKQMKGTAAYDTPAVLTIEDLIAELENIELRDVHLSGEPTAESPPDRDSSERVATTEWVINEIRDGVLAISAYTHDQMIPSSIWEIHHNLEKYPSVTVVDSAGNEVEGAVFHDSNRLATVSFSGSFSGRAFCN